MVLVEYPRHELWTLGSIAGDAVRVFAEAAGLQLVSTYVPTTPNPTSGYFLMAPRKDVVMLYIPVEMGLKIILSIGVEVPDDLREQAADSDGTLEVVAGVRSSIGH